jgi:hypothetical protein
MSLKIAKLVTFGTQIAAAIGDLYTVLGGETVRIGKMTLHNTGATVEDVEIRILESGGATGDEFTLAEKSLAAGETWDVPYAAGHNLAAGDKIQGVTTTASTVNVFISGIRYVQ